MRYWQSPCRPAGQCAPGPTALLDLNGGPDLFDRLLQNTQVGLADEQAVTASLVIGQGRKGHPAVLIRGLERGHGNGSTADLIRSRDQDLFR